MRFSNVILGLALGGMATGLGLVGCSGDSGSGAGGGSSSSSGSPASASSGANMGGCTGMCCPTDPVCTAVNSQCIGLTDNKGKSKFTLRMSQLDITKPPGLTNPLLKGVIATGVEINLDKCNLAGGGTFNLLMQFDTAGKMLTVGGAHPAADPTKGYTFVNEMIQGIAVAPVTGAFTIDATGKFMPMKGVDIVLPIYLAVADAMPSVLLPLHQSTIVGTLTADQNCVGKFNGDKLDPKTGCAGTDANPAFDTSQADLSGYMTLEEADKVEVSAVGQTLCVLITGDAATYGDGGSPVKCKRDAMQKIVFKGDWCAATNKAADASCFDAAALAGKLAASSVMAN